MPSLGQVLWFKGGKRAFVAMDEVGGVRQRKGAESDKSCKWTGWGWIGGKAMVATGFVILLEHEEIMLCLKSLLLDFLRYYHLSLFLSVIFNKVHKRLF